MQKQTEHNHLLINTAIYGNISAIRTILENGADVDFCSGDGKTLLIKAAGAAGSGKDQAVRLFLEYGADVNAADKTGRTALMEAVFLGNISTVEILLASGARVDIQDNTGRTPLMTACQGLFDRRGTIAVLIAAGADVNISDNCGRTAVMYAAEAGYIGFIKTLIRSGADINIRNKDGKTAIDILKEKHPKKHDRWMEQKAVKERLRKLRKEDLLVGQDTFPDFNI
jgi:ankyrin repeat protein